MVTGVNLPMLIEVLGRRMLGGTLPELVETARTARASGVKVLSEIFTPHHHRIRRRRRRALMDIKLLRIDSRLVHGQVANNWAGTLGAEAILAVSDGAANDELRKTLMDWPDGWSSGRTVPDGVCCWRSR